MPIYTPPEKHAGTLLFSPSSAACRTPSPVPTASAASPLSFFISRIYAGSLSFSGADFAGMPVLAFRHLCFKFLLQPPSPSMQTSDLVDVVSTAAAFLSRRRRRWSGVVPIARISATIFLLLFSYRLSAQVKPICRWSSSSVAYSLLRNRDTRLNERYWFLFALL